MWVLFVWHSFSYIFWVHSNQSNAVDDILQFESQFWVKNKIVGFIFDTFETGDLNFFQKQVNLLGKDRIYHISISPFGYTAKEVLDWAYDKEYKRFFSFVKKNNLKVIFRTAHEMNWSWYSWSGNPEDFKKMWQRVYKLSRDEGLTRENILFDFSVNSIDLPKWKNGRMIVCNPWYKKISNCLSFEDYYPGDKYVDIMGLTLYNWWRARSKYWAYWRSFANLLFDKKTKIFYRLKKYWKPIVIDELWTTAVNFSGKWSFSKVLNSYKYNYYWKNQWLKNAAKTLKQIPEIVAVVYFNKDKTNWFKNPMVWELDWSVFNYRTNKIYTGVLDLYSNQSGKLPFVPTKQEILAKYVDIINKFVKFYSMADIEKIKKVKQKLELLKNNKQYSVLVEYLIDLANGFLSLKSWF